MAKKQTIETITNDIKTLNDLKVKRVVEGTDAYDEEIKRLSDKIDLFNFGINSKDNNTLLQKTNGK